MWAVVQAGVAIIVFLVVHVTVMALAAQALGVSVRSVTYGVGPTLFRRGKIQIKAVPVAGSVRLKDSREEALDEADTADAFNHQAVWKQVLLPLSGVVAALLLSLLLLGSGATESFLAAFQQILGGAIAPLSDAQSHLHAFERFTVENSFAAVIGLVMSKLAAYNLLPFGGFNGGQALINLARWGRPEAVWEAAVSRWLVVPALLVIISWVVAVGFYVFR